MLSTAERKYQDKHGVKVTTGLSIRTIERHTVPRGDLPCIKIGSRILYDPADVDLWVKSHRVSPVDVSPSAAS